MTTRKNQAIKKREINGVVYEGRSVFDDLGFSEDETVKLMTEVADNIAMRNAMKMFIVEAINEQISQRQLNITKAAELLQISRPRLSNIAGARLEKFTIDAALDLMFKLGKEVKIQFVDAQATKAVASIESNTRSKMVEKRSKAAHTQSAHA